MKLQRVAIRPLVEVLRAAGPASRPRLCFLPHFVVTASAVCEPDGPRQGWRAGCVVLASRTATGSAACHPDDSRKGRANGVTQREPSAPHSHPERCSKPFKTGEPPLPRARLSHCWGRGARDPLPGQTAGRAEGGRVVPLGRSLPLGARGQKRAGRAPAGCWLAGSLLRAGQGLSKYLA